MMPPMTAARHILASAIPGARPLGLLLLTRL
ncbi:hypothetical protein OG2516_13369 [Oceanicola granulosus HTCC2516]|uniref:Uncharacterized protein n=1 Tax=Oceanicola granulosus (strain ATCC BAA-861 / DSM 15982 / KCTC 12143 / HTCC2516) TaxID=314256 RepID=Q2CGZ4_OCEGH|nr:hypothetical protein OG2516_13369 [Oceanicola granulosus HTCC2516]